MKNKDVLFDDIFDKNTPITDKTKKQYIGKIVPGNVRLSKGMYRTDKEKEQYIKESLDEPLP